MAVSQLNKLKIDRQRLNDEINQVKRDLKKRSTVRGCIELLLQKTGRPMRNGEIYNRLRRQKQFDGMNLLTAINVELCRRESFVQIRRGVYGLRGVEY